MANMVLQNGEVTPGHFTTWVTDGIIQDGGPIPAAQKVLATLLSANFSSIQDQAIFIPPAITAFSITGIIVTNASTSLSTATGGFYTAPMRGGSAIVSGGQGYSTLSGPNMLLTPSLTNFTYTARFSANNLGPLTGDTSGSLVIYFALTLPQITPATADIYLLGIDLTP